MTKSTTRKVTCMGCGESYNAKREHICDMSKASGRNFSKPQHAKSNKLFFGKGGR